MRTIEQFASVVPYGQTVLQKAEGIYDFSKQRTVNVYQRTKKTWVDTRENYRQFRGNLENTINNIIKETINEVLMRFENAAGVQNTQKSQLEAQKVRVRLQGIFQALFRQYVLKSRVMNNGRVQSIIKLGRKYSLQYAVPLYANLKATLIVSKQMLVEFLQSYLNVIRCSFQQSKDTVLIFIAGNFNQENLKNKIYQGINSFKRFTVTAVSRGLEIKVDRQSMIENYDKFAVNFLEIMKEMRNKGDANISQIKKKSRNLYKQVVSRIRAKQLQIRTNMKMATQQTKAIETQTQE